MGRGGGRFASRGALSARTSAAARALEGATAAIWHIRPVMRFKRRAFQPRMPALRVLLPGLALWTGCAATPVQVTVDERAGRAVEVEALRPLASARRPDERAAPCARRPEDLRLALVQALASNQPAVVDVVTDINALAPLPHVPE